MAVSPTPLSASTNYSNPVRPDVLAADPDVILIAQSDIPIELQADLVLQNIGGTELIQIIRHDMVNGQDVSYQPIKNIKALAVEFNPNTIVGFVPTLQGNKESYSISLDDCLVDNPIYIDGEDIVVQLQNLTDTDVIELAVCWPEKQTLLGEL